MMEYIQNNEVLYYCMDTPLLREVQEFPSVRNASHINM